MPYTNNGCGGAGRLMPGLRPYSETKDSGVELLGDVPGHWQVRTLGQVGRFWKGNGGSKEDEIDAGIPCIRYGDLYTKHTLFIHDSRAFVSRERAKNYTPIEFGDVLFAASGETIEEIGKSAVNLIRGDVVCGGDVILFRANQPIDPSFLGYATDCRPATVQKARMGRGFTVVHIYASQLKRLALVLPPVPEQMAIAQFLDHARHRIHNYIHAKEKLFTGEISYGARPPNGLLNEFLMRLISEVTTGKLDVREAAADLPARNPEDVSSERLGGPSGDIISDLDGSGGTIAISEA